MAIKYLWSGAAGAANGSSWADAYTTLAAAIAAVTDGDTIKVHKAHTEEVAADTTYTIASRIAIICVDKDAGDTPTPMGTAAWIGHSSTNRRVTITTSGGASVYIYGLTIRVSGSTADNIGIATGSGEIVLEDGYLWLENTATTSLMQLSGGATARARLRNCTLRFGSTGQTISFAGLLMLENCSISGAGSLPGALLTAGSGAGDVTINACDLSNYTATLLSASGGSADIRILNSKLHASVTLYPTRTLNGNGHYMLEVYNSSYGDEHYHFAHYNGLGETIVSTGIHADDGATWNLAGNKYSWKITTSSLCSIYHPYISPWVYTHNETLSAITPALECLRDNSGGAVFQDDDVWAEFSYQGTAGYTLGVLVDDRMALLGTPADQASSSIAWTGATGTPGKFRLAPASSITPAEIGPLAARVFVGEPSVTVYVDPQIRT